MRDMIRVAKLVVVGFVVIFLVYPFLHEMGHALAAMVLRVEILDFQVVPIPSVRCNVRSEGVEEIVAIGFGGMLLPFLTTVFAVPKKFWIWYVWFVIEGSCLLSFLISIIGVAGYRLGKPIKGEDITQVMEYAPELAGLYYALLMVLLVVSGVLMVRSGPVRRCVEMLEG